MLAPVARWVLGHRRAVVAGWLVILVVSLIVVPHVQGRLSQTFDQPGTSSYRANARIARLFGTGGIQQPEQLVVQAPPGARVTAASITAPVAAALIGAEKAALTGPSGPIRV